MHIWCLNLSLLRRKKLTPPKSRNNQGTSIEFEIESLSSDFQRLGDALNYVDDFAKEIGNTSKILAKNESLRCKFEHLELENKNLKEKNINLMSITLAMYQIQGTNSVLQLVIQMSILIT